MKLPRCTKCNAALDNPEVTSMGLIVCVVCGHEFSQEWYQNQKMALNPNAMKTFVLDGKKIGSLSDFYDEVHRVLCPEFSGFGRNLNALVDVLRGGFGVFDEGESIQIILTDSNLLKRNLTESELRKIMNVFTEADNIDFHSN